MADSNRLEHFPISFFAMVMGLSGLTIAWEKAQNVFHWEMGITPPLFTLTALVFAVLTVLYGVKLMRYREAVLKELHHPIKLNFFPAISISLLLLSIAVLPMSRAVSEPLWLLGTALHLLFTLYVVSVWIHHEHFEIHHLNPAWFIPVVGNVLVPVAGMPLGYVELSWFFFSIGLLFWVLLLTVIFYRILFHHPIDEKLMPTLFILIAPPAVGFIAYFKLTGELDNFARILYFSGLFLTLLLFTQLRRFARLKFFLSWWAYSFPVAAITIATLLKHEHTGTAFYLYAGLFLLLLLTAIVVLLLVRTAMAVRKRGICQPE
ncbi:MAG: SLAC1 anion channel family protein [Gammaproteobacteria bacterium]|nr:SLAC1 anion channel family protein [Gammaproteobacteria bacterium]